ncbi:hypothetical protein AB0E55_15530 [Amycolatopsis keratiniphila]|nr:hypothetical protein [Amycolatopsis keratiniphila]
MGRRRVLDTIAPWANDVPRDAASVAVEFVYPSVTSDNIDEASRRGPAR